ncbi:MAG: Rieske 2Fe-2S domain-containing protein [Sulfolobales archaeon]
MGVKRRDVIRYMAALGVAGAIGSLVIPTIRYVTPPAISGAAKYPRSQLFFSNGEPVRASRLPVNTPYFFFYPLKDTQAILVNLGDANNNPVEVKPIELPVTMYPLKDFSLAAGGTDKPIEGPPNASKYRFPGGVGPTRSIVAYSFICQHLGCIYPQLRFHKPGEPTSLRTNPPEIGQRGGVFHCRCHGSVYDPYRGAAVLLDPAIHPLPDIILEWDQSTDYLYAVGVVGPTIFGKVCNLCGDVVGDRVTVYTAEEFAQLALA